jgi:TPR repeat protein
MAAAARLLLRRATSAVAEAAVGRPSLPAPARRPGLWAAMSAAVVGAPGGAAPSSDSFAVLGDFGVSTALAVAATTAAFLAIWPLAELSAKVAASDKAIAAAAAAVEAKTAANKESAASAVARDYVEALKLARYAAEQQPGRLDKFALGELYRLGLGVAKSVREAVNFHAHSFAQGSELSKEVLCELAAEGVPEATAALHRAGVDAPLRAADAAAVAAGRCPLGNLEAQEAACRAWMARPLAALRAAAEAGDLAAMEDLGERFHYGLREAPKDDAQAVVWRRRAAAGNVARAQSAFAFMHANGEGGLERSDAKAVALYRAAAFAGYASALFNLGCCFDNGRGVPRDRAEAVRLWLQAADKGNANAEAALARAYILGEGVAHDYAAALRFARRAADKGHASGESNLGSLYGFGWGVPKDVREGIKWWAKAAAKGKEGAINNLRAHAANGVPEAAAALRHLRLAP